MEPDAREKCSSGWIDIKIFIDIISEKCLPVFSGKQSLVSDVHLFHAPYTASPYQTDSAHLQRGYLFDLILEIGIKR